MTNLNSLRQDYGMSGYGYGSYPYGSGNGQTGASQGYEQQLLQYISQVRGYLSTMQQGTQAYAQVQNYLSTAYFYLQQYFPQDAMSGDLSGGAGWDPMAGSYPGATGTNPTTDGTPPPQYGEMIWQDSSKVKWDGSDPVVYGVSQQSDAREQDFFQQDVTIQIPYNGAKAKAQLVPDDSVAGAQMLKVTITMPDGSTRVTCVHNVTAKSNIHIQSVDPANITLDASVTSSAVASQITAEDISDPTTSAPQGDQPTKLPDGSMGYDGSDFELYPSGDGKDYHVSSRGAVNFHASSNTEYWSVAWDNTKNQYVITAYSDAAHTKVLNTYHVDDMSNLKISFDIDPTHIEFLGSLAGSYQSSSNGQTGSASAMSNDHTINTNDPHGKKLSLLGADGTTTDTSGVDPANVTPPDGPVENGTATYNNSPNGNVDVNAYFGDGYIQNYNITAPGQVSIHKTNYSDSAVITKNADGTYTIVVTSGDDPTKKATFTVKGPPSNIDLDFLPANVKYKDLSKNPAVSTETPYTPGALGTGVKVDGEESISGSTYPQEIQDLATYTGTSAEEIIAAIKSTYPAARGDEAQFQQWLTNNFPPQKTDQNFLQFLLQVDPALKGALDTFKGLQGNDPNFQVTLNKIKDLMGGDLQKLYGSSFDSSKFTVVMLKAGNGFPIPILIPGVEGSMNP